MENFERDGTTRPPDLPLEKPVCRSGATVRIGHGTTDWFQIGKGVRQGCILSPCLFNLYAEHIMRNARLEETQAGIKIAGRNINNLRYADGTTLMEEREELKSLLMKVKEESEKKFGLKLNIQKTKIMASSPMTSWQIDGERMEPVTDFLFLGSKMTVGCDCSHEIKRYLLLGRKAMTNLDSVLKGRNITLLTQIFQVGLSTKELMLSNYGIEEDLRFPQTANNSIQSILMEINTEYSLEKLLLKLHSLAT